MRLLFLTLALFLSGCAFAPTYPHQAPQRDPATVPLGQSTLQTYISDRIAAVVSGVELDPPDSAGRIRIHGTAGRAATAIALTTDGYYLTAAHCTDPQPIYILLRTAKGTSMARARVVHSSWSGASQDPISDFALIKADFHPTAVFQWAPDTSPQFDQEVISAMQDPHGMRQFSWTSTVVRAWKHSSGDQAVQVIAFDSPVGPGFSGGPLLNLQGQLLGLNTRSGDTLRLRNGHRLPVGLAIRPNPTLLSHLITQDRAR